MHQHSIILDGHACSGKSTVARSIAERLRYSYVKPFDGTVGEINRFLVDQSDFLRLMTFRSSVVDYFSASTATVPCVFDRLHPSTLSLLPEDQWPERLEHASRTVILWCDEDTTARRLSNRGRDTWRTSEHALFIRRFRLIAEQFRLFLVDTSYDDVEVVAERIVAHFCRP